MFFPHSKQNVVSISMRDYVTLVVEMTFLSQVKSLIKNQNKLKHSIIKNENK